MEERQIIRVYVTKYALSSGIHIVDCKVSSSGPDWLIDWDLGRGWQSYNKKDWSATRAEAIARAEEMRAGKIASLKKQIAKLENMTFEPEEL